MKQTNFRTHRPTTPRRGGLKHFISGSWRATALAAIIGLPGFGSLAQAQIPTILTDKIYQGSGTINLLKDVSAANLQSYLQQNGGALLGVDVNENLAGNEMRDSVGIAIKNIELVITTTTGTMTFRDFYTSTTAMIREAGSATPQQFYTLFGTAGSSAINGGTTDFDPTKMDDVLEIRNVAFTGTLLSAQLNVTFLTTANTRVQGNESFFDYSNGPEDFALIDRAAAQVIETTGAGLAAAPDGVTYVAQPPPPVVPGAPAPPVMVLAMLGGLLAWRARNRV